MKVDPKGLRQRYVTALQKLKYETRRRRVLERALKARERHYAKLLEHSRQAQEHLRCFSRQVLLTQEEERKMISRELHNKVAQILAAINVHLEMLKKEGSGNARGFNEKISRAQRLVQKSVSIVHRFSRELRPTLLDDLGIIPALHAYIKDFEDRTRIPIHFRCDAAVQQLSGARRTALYRVVQEALLHAVQHTKASWGGVSLRKTGSAICMKIAGNGKSFLQQGGLGVPKNGLLGVMGMRERVEMAGGIFSVECVRDKGTSIRVEFPLK